MIGGSDSDWTWFFISLGIICGIIGWGVIETLIWLFSHISISLV